jgi:hypothetical protein
MGYDLVVLFEHPEWQKPLWAALERRGVHYAALDLKRAAWMSSLRGSVGCCGQGCPAWHELICAERPSNLFSKNRG